MVKKTVGSKFTPLWGLVVRITFSFLVNRFSTQVRRLGEALYFICIKLLSTTSLGISTVLYFQLEEPAEC